MNVFIYVEGPSDQAALEQLLKLVIQRKEQQGIRIRFFEAPSGDRKVSIIKKVPVRAISILRNDDNAIVVALPDLYPYNKEVPHESASELQQTIRAEFERVATRVGVEDHRILNRFYVFCLKHELETLVLAAEEALALRLGVDTVPVSWQIPVEDQNNNDPPKAVVARVFHKYDQVYKETVDAPLILGLSEYQKIANACPQCFGPFIEFLENLKT